MIAWISLPVLMTATGITWVAVSRVYGKPNFTLLIVSAVVAAIIPFIAFGSSNNTLTNSTTTVTSSAGYEFSSLFFTIVAGGAVSGIALFIAHQLLDWIKRPILEIDKEASLIIRTVHLPSGLFGSLAGIELDQVPYMVNRIRVKNTGKSAAKNCKAALEAEQYRELVCWSLPKERYVITINSKDGEYVDLCAVSQRDPSMLFRDQTSSGGGVRVFGDKERRLGATLTPQDVPRRIAPTEEGWQNPINRNRSFDEIGQGEIHFTLTITAENASPCLASITILQHQDGEGRIVAFA